MKRSLTALLALLFLCGSLVLPAAAAGQDTRASDYIASTQAIMTKGGRGQVVITGSITAYKLCTKIGLEKIDIYQSNGSYVTTITGSFANGLLDSNTGTHAASYTYTGQAGTTYYAIVTLVAGNSTGSDSRFFVTNNLTAPY